MSSEFQRVGKRRIWSQMLWNVNVYCIIYQCATENHKMNKFKLCLFKNCILIKNIFFLLTKEHQACHFQVQNQNSERWLLSMACVLNVFSIWILVVNFFYIKKKFSNNMLLVILCAPKISYCPFHVLKFIFFVLYSWRKYIDADEIQHWCIHHGSWSSPRGNVNWIANHWFLCSAMMVFLSPRPYQPFVLPL